MVSVEKFKTILTPEGNPSLLPECDDDGRGLRTGSDEGDDEEEDEERDQSVAGAVALPRHGVAVLVQVGFDDDELELVDLAAGGRSDDLSALHAGAVSVVPHLEAATTKSSSEIIFGIISDLLFSECVCVCVPQCCRCPRCCIQPGRG